SWDVELLLSRDSRDTRALARDRSRGSKRLIRHGVYAEESAVADLDLEEKHIVAMRALDAVTNRPLVFSHWSAMTGQGQDSLATRLGTVHVTFTEPGQRGLERVSSHLLSLRDEEVVEVHGLLMTSVGRSVIDIAAAASFEEGVIAADSALRSGLPREMLELAVDLAGSRRAPKRIAAVVAFADGRSGSVGESLSRVTMHRMGLHPELQHKHFDHRGYIGKSDFFFSDERAACEFDGRVKFVDERFAPNGAAEVLWNEKVREDRMRAVNDGFARWGWPEARDPHRLAPVLRAAGVQVPSRF
ncbi:hypothetical protein, partial [uncultured Amnibacterium sp.]|uniref:hypothetical protein n=1 Tax=uncultured Amnibacterium sp. TaxID=1631851 RepID=UPI0035C9A7C8